MNQPMIDKSIATMDTDTTGKRWAQAFVTTAGRVVAGYDEHGIFHCFVDTEALFTVAYAQCAMFAEMVTEAQEEA